jgi:hypothetical protein
MSLGQWLVGLFVVAVPSLAFAEEDDDEFELDEPPETLDGAEEAGDLLEGDEGEKTATAGQDDALIYREQQEKVAGLGADEELIAWEQYLETYPESVFLDRIKKRMEALQDELYAERIDAEGGELDAQKREIRFSQGLMLENLNPRTRVQFGFEWGIPDYMNLFVDYEHQLQRNLSFHGGIRRYYTGFRVGGGARWAFIKSTRTQSIVSLLGDVQLNTVPAFPVLRPQIAAGKKFAKVVDAQLQFGAEIETRSDAGIRGIGGANVTWRAADTVAVFGETTLYMQSLASDKGSLFFRFNTINFGLKFYPQPKGAKPGALEMNLGASAPYTSNYWMYHFGSITAQGNYYL